MLLCVYEVPIRLGQREYYASAANEEFCGPVSQGRHARSEQSVDERRDSGRLCEYKQRTEQQKNDDDRQQPQLLVLGKEKPHFPS